MKEENKKVLYCTVDTSILYGKRVTECLETLKGRFGLSANRILQDALIAYEYYTRNTEMPLSNLAIEIKGKDIREKKTLETRKEDKEVSASLLGILSSTASSDYQM